MFSQDKLELLQVCLMERGPDSWQVDEALMDAKSFELWTLYWHKSPGSWYFEISQ
jgi:hypothetical protein